MESGTETKKTGLPVIGVFLILIGIAFFLTKLNLLHYHWKMIVWITLAATGFTALIFGFTKRGRGRVFWGSMILFFSIGMIIHRFYIYGIFPLDYPATISLAVGLSFLILFFYDPGRFGVLIPALFFCGYGILYYLWYWDMVEWFDVKYIAGTYWPVFIILLGMSIMFQRSKSD